MDSPDKKGWGSIIAHDVEWLTKGPRRAIIALGLAGLVSGVLWRNGATPPQRGGWRELSPEDFGEPPHIAPPAEVVIPEPIEVATQD